MGIIVKNKKLDNGVISDFYYKLNYYKSMNETGFVCIVSMWANFDIRKNQPANYFEQEQYVPIVNPPAYSKKISSLTPAEMFAYVYECLTAQIGGEPEKTFSASIDLAVLNGGGS